MEIGNKVKLSDGKIATVVAIHEDGTIVAAFDETWVLASVGSFEAVESTSPESTETPKAE